LFISVAIAAGHGF